MGKKKSQKTAAEVTSTTPQRLTQFELRWMTGETSFWKFGRKGFIGYSSGSFGSVCVSGRCLTERPSRKAVSSG